MEKFRFQTNVFAQQAQVIAQLLMSVIGEREATLFAGGSMVNMAAG